MTELAPRRPALVVSGINFGTNLATEVTISGTVGAALEAGAFGIPALAVSLETDPAYHFTGDDSIDYSTAKTFTRYFARQLLARALPGDVDTLNVNIPADATPYTPWQLTRLSRKRYYVPHAPDRDNGEGRPGYHLMIDPESSEPDSDIRAVKVNRTVSATPLSLDLTSRTSFETLNTCLRTDQTAYLTAPIPLTRAPLESVILE
jgi:5'-nucleotidase